MSLGGFKFLHDYRDSMLTAAWFIESKGAPQANVEAACPVQEMTFHRASSSSAASRNN